MKSWPVHRACADITYTYLTENEVNVDVSSTGSVSGHEPPKSGDCRKSTTPSLKPSSPTTTT